MHTCTYNSICMSWPRHTMSYTRRNVHTLATLCVHVHVATLCVHVHAYICVNSFISKQTRTPRLSWRTKTLPTFIMHMTDNLAMIMGCKANLKVSYVTVLSIFIWFSTYISTSLIITLYHITVSWLHGSTSCNWVNDLKVSNWMSENSAHHHRRAPRELESLLMHKVFTDWWISYSKCP